MGDRHGATLIEVLVTAAIISIAAIAVSLVFVKASATLVTTRQRWLANSFASARIQEMKSRPYAFVPLTPAGEFSAATAATCDCAADDFSQIAEDASYTEDSVTFKRQVCVNLVAPGTWVPTCPEGPNVIGANDVGLRHIRIRVSWTFRTATHSTDMESMVSR